MCIHKNKLLCWLCVVLLSAVAAVTHAEPFARGGRRVSAVVGSGYTMDESYVILGLGIGYFVRDGLELGLDGQAWMGGDPDIYQLKPQVTYIVPTQSRLRPYAGVFYSRIFIEGYDDLDTAGETLFDERAGDPLGICLRSCRCDHLNSFRHCNDHSSLSPVSVSMYQ